MMNTDQQPKICLVKVVPDQMAEIGPVGVTASMISQGVLGLQRPIIAGGKKRIGP